MWSGGAQLTVCARGSFLVFLSQKYFFFYKNIICFVNKDSKAPSSGGSSERTLSDPDDPLPVCMWVKQLWGGSVWFLWMLH